MVESAVMSQAWVSYYLVLENTFWLESQKWSCRGKEAGPSGYKWIQTSTKILMALEQVVPVVPQGTFSVTIRNVPSVLVLPLQ